MAMGSDLAHTTRPPDHMLPVALLNLDPRRPGPATPGRFNRECGRPTLNLINIDDKLCASICLIVILSVNVGDMAFCMY